MSGEKVKQKIDLRKFVRPISKSQLIPSILSGVQTQDQLLEQNQMKKNVSHQKPKKSKTRSQKTLENTQNHNREQKKLTTNSSNLTNLSNMTKASILTNEKELDENLKKLYTKIKSVPNYSAKLAEFLRNYDVHSKHRRITKKKFPRRHIIVHFPFQIFMGDLIEYQRNDFKYANGGHKFILVLIDVFTKKAYARPVKRKNKFDMALALESILLELDHQPNTLITDEGLEFYNKNVEEVLDRYAIHHYSIKTKMKASVVERFIRTLKSRLEKYFVENKTKRWIDVLPQLIENYNNTPHRSIGMPPNRVTDENANKVFRTMFPDIELEAKPRLHKGDIVRKLTEKTIFEKGYKQSWSNELFKVTGIKQAAGRVWYIISDLDGNEQSGIKYYWQLNLVRNDS